MQRLLLALALLLSASAVSAQNLSRADGSTDAHASVSSQKPVFPAANQLGGSVTITQSASQEIVPLTGVACPTPPNAILRRFDLSDFPEVSGGFSVESVQFGVEEVSGAQTATINLYRLDGEFVRANLTLLGTGTVPISVADNLSIVEVPVTGSFDGDDVMVVEWTYPLAQTFFGGNSAGQSGATYVQADGCNIAEPTDVATLGFAEAHWVVNVTGTSGPVTGPNLQVSPGTVAFGSVDVGDTATRTVTVTNNGDASVIIASILYTGDAGVVVDQTGTDLTLDPGDTTTFDVSFTAVTPGAIDGTISIVSNADNSPNTVNVTGTGFIGDDPNAESYPSTDTPIDIPDDDPTGISSTIVIPASEMGMIADLNVDLDITHTYVGDFIIDLAKGGTTVNILTTNACSGDDMVLVVNDEGTDGSLQDDCTSGIGVQAYTTGGQYTPDESLSIFEGTPIAGSYTLTISDNAGIDTGSLNSWALIISGGTVAGEGTPSAMTRLSVSPNPVAGQGQIALTVGTTQDVRVALYDALGREVMVLLDRSVTAGQQAFIGFRTQQLPAGVYVVRATGADVSLTERVTVVR